MIGEYNEQLIAVLLTILSLFGALMVSNKKPAGFALWIFVNIGWIVWSIISSNYGQIPLWLAYSIISYYGWVNWNKEKDKEKRGKGKGARLIRIT